MLNILIVNPPFYRLQDASLVHYPQSCCYMAAMLEEAGFKVKVYNSDFDPAKKTILGNTNHINVKALTALSEKYSRRLADDNDPVWVEICEYVKTYNPDLLIISVFNTTLTAGQKVATMAKRLLPGLKVAFEGSANRGLHCAVDPSKTVDVSIMDFALRKEPEETIVELAKALESGVSDFAGIRGLSWKRSDGEFISNPDRAALEDLDSLPFPARHLLEGYENMPPHAFQGIYGSRGCPFECIFCGLHTSFGYKARFRSAKNMVDEIEHVYKTYGTRYYYICDDIFFIKKDRAREFCDLLLERKLPVYWSAQTRAEMVDDETLSLMKRAGGQHVAVGVEVGNPRIRELIKKGNTIDDVRRCAEKVKKSGLYMVAFCIIGLPWEGREEIEETVNLVREIDPYIVFPYLPTPAVGTELANIMMEKNPEGLAALRDRFHLDTSVDINERLSSDERRAVLEDALSKLVQLNKHNLVVDFFRRPGFYTALAGDMAFFKRPSYVYHYLKDYAFG